MCIATCTCCKFATLISNMCLQLQCNVAWHSATLLQSAKECQIFGGFSGIYIYYSHIYPFLYFIIHLVITILCFLVIYQYTVLFLSDINQLFM